MRAAAAPNVAASDTSTADRAASTGSPRPPRPMKSRYALVVTWKRHAPDRERYRRAAPGCGAVRGGGDPASAAAQPPLTSRAWLIRQAIVLEDRLFVSRHQLAVGF